MHRPRNGPQHEKAIHRLGRTYSSDLGVRLRRSNGGGRDLVVAVELVSVGYCRLLR